MTIQMRGIHLHQNFQQMLLKNIFFTFMRLKTMEQIFGLFHCSDMYCLAIHEISQNTSSLRIFISTLIYAGLEVNTILSLQN